MHIVTISGKVGSGKSETLRAIAEANGGEVVQSMHVINAMPLLMKKLTALNTNTYIDEVYPEHLAKYEKLAKLYPNTYRLFLALSA